VAKMKLKTKATWVIGLIGVSVMSLSFFGFATVHTEIIIPVPPDVVWSVLTDTSGYKEWNPVLIPVEGEGEMRGGRKLKYRMIQPNGNESIVGAKVVNMVNQQLLNQYGGIPGVLTFDHKWLLDPVDGGTRVVQHEDYRGIGVWFWDYSWVEPAYAQANEALKNRALQIIMEERGDKKS